ncbi:Lrp/AsnC family transcriptional regulator [Piscinibacter gummiphilus]|jgi:Lrp/AsnC family leucine-responsive transcriptional regulator|uniref:Lrp/AsnC family transcriptional regulator n=1 Tax=Piscinibacter gummiphilus TaxID=946333 RepID=A0ABZ0CU20_9BURK|nr:Lrp/AsnC family transcriptional regulator [Piscinibacter gummiphilus]WOB06432.1 Lrp/AsnC family transcriptional regulator [Piscinibacter gummiphilus]
MDRIDHEILRHLTRDGRLTFRELGEAVHLSANAVAERFRRLQESGTIRHIRAVLDPQAMGRSLEAQIEIKLSAQTSALEFENALRHMPQVMEAALMTGSFDYAIRVACENSHELMQVTEALRKHPGVSDTYTRLVLREIELSGMV